ncbi:hypothetical protein COY06_02340, partial [Candidatus Peregrinibacteria bacterium CG_4_10_14_0_2_um_filter_41_8]
EKKVAAAALDIHGLDIDKKYMVALENANLTLLEQLKGLSATDLATIEGIDQDGGEAIHAAIK